jgi:glycerophosphoryl diester phosphodiesterase
MESFDLQGHRGARGLKPENTLPSFEAALDAGVSSIETDIRLTADQNPVLCHDLQLHPGYCRRYASCGPPNPDNHPFLGALTTEQLYCFCADIVQDRRAFPLQNADVTPVAALYAEKRGLHPFFIPMLHDLFEFVESYAGDMGRRAGKSAEQRDGAEQVWFDLELKCIPYLATVIGNNFDDSLASLQQSVLEAIRAAGVSNRVRIRSFDHRSLLAFRRLAAIPAGVLIDAMAPVAPEEVAKAALADTYCPNYQFLDESLVRRLHAARVRVHPYTVNEEADWDKLVTWGVDGITTDYPDQLASFLRKRNHR